MKALIIICCVLQFINFCFFVLFFIGVARESGRGNREVKRLVDEYKKTHPDE